MYQFTRRTLDTEKNENPLKSSFLRFLNLRKMITPEQMSTIIKKPMPREMVLYLEMGKNKAALGDKWK